MEELIKVRELSKTIEGKLLFENASFDVYSNNCIGLLGPNGCGKTTLFKILLGREQASYGEVYRKENLQIRYLEQVPISSQDETVNDFFIRNTQDESIKQRIREYE